MIGDIRALLARHLPDVEVRSLTESGQGLDNEVYEVNGELIVRGSRAVDPVATRREVELLAAVRALATVAVPEVVFADYEQGVLAYRKLPGEPLNLHPVPDPALLAAPLGRLLSALHGAEPGELRELAPLDLYPAPTLLVDAGLDYRDVERHVPYEQRPLVEEFLRRRPPDEPRSLRFCHNDLGGEHLLVDVATSSLTGVIDWTDAAVTDPAHDFALIYRDLGPAVFEQTVSHYDLDFDETDRARALFYARCALIEDLAYGLSTGPRHYADAALAHLTRTFS
ncbi:phosphotransferase [Nonomuraea sp. NEAU-A123]|uniref:phosphotransferase n=1 Tax=Nonomuraea sp. NEAU-A123 TaxID=2839649 RepID=UPI001BE3F12D|nr:phosphotransferase [Nonomuraea sp. NEAU-A123]MBT2234122.1 phosphotransferase [Nonomuraea sp. NEAU-A123]